LYIGYLYNKFYEVNISTINTEIWLKFEKSISPICKLKNLLDINKFVQIIDKITKREGELQYIWVIIHHNWYLHKSLTNHHTYVNNSIPKSIQDFKMDPWFNIPVYKGYRRRIEHLHSCTKINEDTCDDMPDYARLMRPKSFFEYGFIAKSELNLNKGMWKYDKKLVTGIKIDSLDGNKNLEDFKPFCAVKK
jgi:hypothetical protein